MTSVTPVKLMKPMLANSKAITPETAKLPALVSLKLDGIRAVITADGPRTRSLKPIKNKHIASLLATLPVGLDGELVMLDEPGVANFRGTGKAVTSSKGEPDFVYFVYDNFVDPELPFEERVLPLLHWHSKPAWVRVVDQEYVFEAADLRARYEAVVSEGHEGLIVRDPKAPYKYGRATPKSGHMDKLKPFDDAEGVVVAVVEMMRNENEAKTNELGHTARSTAKAGKVPAGMMGALVVESDMWPGLLFEIGTGFSQEDRIDMWKVKPLGQTVTFKYSLTGGYDRPRSAVFKGFRETE